MELFKNNPTNPKYALQIWLILISKASNRQTITYGDLAKLMGFKGAGMMGGILDYVMHYCDQNKLPPLTVLVVAAGRGAPSEGLITSQNIDADREAVYAYDWFSLVPPTPDELKSARDRVKS